MDSDFWHARWQAGQTGFHQNDINAYLIRYWPSLELDLNTRVFVPLCGKTLDMVWLRDQGHSVVGNEISPVAVKAFFAEHGMAPEIQQEGDFSRWSCGHIEILCGDFFRLTAAAIGRIDALYDRAALIALHREQRARYAARITQLLDSRTPGLLVTLDYAQEEMDGPPFAVSADEVNMLYQDDFLIEPLSQIDVLSAHPQFQENGLSSLTEAVYRMHRR